MSPFRGSCVTLTKICENLLILTRRRKFLPSPVVNEPCRPANKYLCRLLLLLPIDYGKVTTSYHFGRLVRQGQDRCRRGRMRIRAAIAQILAAEGGHDRQETFGTSALRRVWHQPKDLSSENDSRHRVAYHCFAPGTAVPHSGGLPSPAPGTFAGRSRLPFHLGPRYLLIRSTSGVWYSIVLHSMNLSVESTRKNPCSSGGVRVLKGGGILEHWP